MNYWIFLALCLSLNTQAITPTHEKKLQGKKEITYEDLQHENLGCPENSECSKTSGLLLKSWSNYIENTNIKNIHKKIESFRKKYGIPILFLTTDASKKTVDPILWNSRCEHHNPKEKIGTIYKGMKFFRNNPKSKLIKLVPVKVLTGKNAGKIFELPYGEQALLFLENKLITITDYEEKFYTLSISENGKWTVINLLGKLKDKALLEKTSIECKVKTKPDEYFLNSYCTEIWDADQKATVQVEQMWSCP